MIKRTCLSLLPLVLLVAACSSIRIDSPRRVSGVTVSQAALPAELLNPDVSQQTIHHTICVAGYTAQVRPSVNFTNGVKAKLMREQNLPTATMANYELDHRIPLALGGHPRHLANLALQSWEGTDGAKRKDRLERKLQSLVCAGSLPLDVARREIYSDWQAAYAQYVIAPRPAP